MTTNYTCRQCGKTQSENPDDDAMRAKIAPVIGGKTYVPPSPGVCHRCIQQQLTAQGNQLHLYRRTCDKTGKPIVSNYHPDAPYPVYNLKTWWSDEWDAKEYGREYDFSRPFFEQYKELLDVVPRFSLHTTYEFDENSEYINYCTKNKNCYFIFDSDLNENCYYSYSVNRSRSSMDSYRIGQCELCYECVDCVLCYGSSYLQDCNNCNSSWFLKNCIGCSNCLFCCNLQNKEYHIHNKPVSKQEFEEAVATLTAQTTVKQAHDHFRTFVLEFPQKMIHGVQNENVSGDYLTNCKDAYRCFDSRDLWDCRYNYQGWMDTKDAMDVREVGNCERAYMSCYSGMNSNGLFFSSHCFEGKELLHCSFCAQNTHDCFGCVGLKRSTYCILNKQYTKEEYESLVPKIIEQMCKTPLRLPDGSSAGQEWGEFMPMTLSSFAYNESIAQQHFPLTKEEAGKQGLLWRDDDQSSSNPPSAGLPTDVSELTEAHAKEIFACGHCRKNYKLTVQEIKMLKQMNIAPPDTCFLCRHAVRIAKRNPEALWDRACGKCAAPIKTSYQPSRPEIIYCEQCYLSTVY